MEVYLPFQNYNIHSIYFDEYNSWDEWHMIPTVRPSMPTPQMVENYIDIPGANGALDLSTALNGYPNFQNRSGSFSFMLINGFGDWVERRDSIIKKLHGKEMKLTLSDDPDYYYKGRITVGDWTTNKDMSSIDINFNVDPYAYNRKITWIHEDIVPSGDSINIGDPTVPILSLLSNNVTSIEGPIPLYFKVSGLNSEEFVILEKFINSELNMELSGFALYDTKTPDISLRIENGIVSYSEIIVSNINGNNEIGLVYTNQNSREATVKLGYRKIKL